MTRRAKILVVDDNEINLEIMKEILGDQCKLVMATSGEQALELMPAEEPELVLLDIMMPGLDGYETCRRIKGDPDLRNTKVILVSAKAMTFERLKGYEAGADDYVTKPFDRDELVAKVNVFLQLRSTEEVEHMKTELLSLVAHEIRTPLTGIIPAGEVLINEPEMAVEERRMWGQMVLDGAKRLLCLAERGMLLCELQQGREPLPTRQIDLRAVADSAVEACSRDAEAKRITVETNHDDRAVPVDGDADLLMTAMMCLVELVLRSAAEDAEVNIDFVQSERGLDVSIDLSRGTLDESSLRQLAEPLSAREVEGEPVGSDITLALASAIARAHGGALTAVPRAGGGVIFTASLPVVLADESSRAKN